MSTEPRVEQPDQVEAEIMASIESERFTAVPQHEGSLKNLIERYGSEPAQCPYIQSMGAAGIELIAKFAEAENNPDRGPTIRELLAKKRAVEQQPELENKQPAQKAKAEIEHTAQTAHEQLAKTNELLDIEITPDIVQPLTKNMEQQAIANVLALQQLAAVESQPSPLALEVPSASPKLRIVQSKEAGTVSEKPQIPAKLLPPAHQEAIHTIPDQPQEASDVDQPTVVLAETHTTESSPAEGLPIIPITEAIDIFDEVAEVETDTYEEEAFINVSELEPATRAEVFLDEDFAEWIDLTESYGSTIGVEADTDHPTAADVLPLNYVATEISEPLGTALGQFEAQLLVPLSPEDASATMALIDSLSEAVEEAQKIGNTLGEKQLIVTEQLQELSMQLFDRLRIEYNKEMVERFVQSIIRNEFAAATNTKEQSLELLNTIGTHEHMLASHRSITDGIVQFLGQKILPPALLGKYALAA